ncbi:MAG: sn-glycerol-1-phosphate dehydrogenase, partial [Opitutaceae bacterium]|nr:sn-glycerol-1-phosphate dehydrogenase [Opitutaceae bacterium]
LTAPLIPPPRQSLVEALAAASETKELLLSTGASSNVVDVFRRQFPGHKAIVVCDPTTHRVAGNLIDKKLHGARLAESAAFVLADPDLYAEYRFVEKLEPVLRQSTAIAVAVGSGTINDLVKLASHRVGRPYMCVSTAASMDGYTAFGASITHHGAKQTFNCPAPRAVLADLEVLRHAPPEMTASGYADLQAKITAGADWLVAHALGVEPIEPRAWAIVQGGLRDALADPAGARRGDAKAIEALTEGLMLGGFAMQWTKSSRPASGAEHQFSHLWDMEHHTHNGHAPSHGFKVGLATLAIATLYEAMLRIPFEKLDVEHCVSSWPDKSSIEAEIRRRFAASDFLDTALHETAAKHASSDELREQLGRLVRCWPALREQLRRQLLPSTELKRRLEIVGAPTRAAELGLTAERLRQTFHRAYFIRRRFTILDLAIRTQSLDRCLDSLFGPGGPLAS